MRRSSQGLFVCIFTLASFTACTLYKSSTFRSQTGTTGAAPGSNSANGNVSGPLMDVSMTLANTKLTPVGGTLTAKISFNGQNISQDFTPAGTQSTLSNLKLPQASGILTVEIYQGDALRFVAKKANTTLSNAANTVVVDDCLILRAPWVGTTNEGSCEWTITEN